MIQPLTKLLSKEFLKEIDPHVKLFCREIKKSLKEENYEIIAITGYAGVGKSQLAAILGCLLDDKYSFEKSICFIPIAKQMEKRYLDLPMYSFFHIDEASRSIHKHKWYEKTQQRLITLYDTERENHYLCTALLMPRFQNFTENFRNFFIKYWINIICRGIALVYKRDEDKDTKDPWNIDDSSKLKMKYWRGKRIFERTPSDIVRMEQKTKNYWFYFKVPEIPEDVWQIYKDLKAQSRIDLKDNEELKELESYKDKLERERTDKWAKIIELKNSGMTYQEMAVELNVGQDTIRKHLRSIEAYHKLKGDIKGLQLLQNSSGTPPRNTNNIYSLGDSDNSDGSSRQSDKVQKVKPKEEEWDINGLSKKD